MSAFLGPIHFWLYNKIKFQEALTSDIAFLAVKEGWASAETVASYTVEDLQPLDQLIDVMNIHGWLQDRIHDAEGRYAALVTALLNEDSERLGKLKQAAYEFGRQNAVETGATPDEAFRKLDDILLNGMPCDRVNVITAQEENIFAWEQAQDLHAQYWQAAKGNPTIYYALRSEVMRGMLATSGLSFSEPEFGKYEITLA